MVDNILTFAPSVDVLEKTQKVEIPVATSNPYDLQTSPPDILQYLPPDGSTFSLFSDPYAKMTYHLPRTGNVNARYWMENRMETHSFPETELKLIHFLSQHRCATRSQLTRAIFTESDNKDRVKQFFKKCHERGIISAFSWITPCRDGRKKPLVYGLTRVGAEAAEKLFHTRVPDKFKFHAVNFPNGAGPSMNTFYPFLAANEFYSQLKSIDRVVNWEREPNLLLNDKTTFRPYFVADVIKDAGDLKKIWVEPIRITNGWYNRLINRFTEIQSAMEKLPEHIEPNRLILIVDSDSRIPIISELAEVYMPDANFRFTTDERLLAGLTEDTFVVINPVTSELVNNVIPWMIKDTPGMKASEYLAHQTMDVEDEFEDI